MSKRNGQRCKTEGKLRLLIDDGITIVVAEEVVLEAIAESATEALDGEVVELDVSEHIVHEPATLTEAVARNRFDAVRL